jgi:hypothetical protein
MRRIILLASLLALGACSPTVTDDITKAYALPPEMQDCKAFRLQTETDYPNLYAIRCPNSETTTEYKTGSSNHRRYYRTVVIDGVAHEVAPTAIPTVPSASAPAPSLITVDGATYMRVQ